eukprot:c39069_g1_i1 orf=2-157(-)
MIGVVVACCLPSLLDRPCLTFTIPCLKKAQPDTSYNFSALSPKKLGFTETSS